MDGSAVVAALAQALFFSSVASLVGVDVLSWRRTSPIRRGRDPPPRRPRGLGGTSRTSRATFLPAAAGVAALAWSGSGLGGPAVRILFGLGGLLVTVSGLAARVVSLELAPERLVIRYSRRGPFELAWVDCRALRPPHWPMGGWRVAGQVESRILMPTDVLGGEWVLASIVDRVGLRFDGRAWTRVPRPASVSRTA